MADGAGGGIGKAVADSAKDIAADLTVNLAKDFFDQVGGTTKSQQQQASQPQASSISNVQKNIRMATISRRIQQMATQRKIAAQQVKQQEESRKHQMQQEKEQKKQHETKKSQKDGNWISRLVQRSGKGEMRGQKLTG